jgi:1,4-alpha-glucan branching enzyme
MYSVTTAVPALPALGANLFADRSGAGFRVWAPYASAVNVRLSPSAAQALQPFPLSADPTNPGYWAAAITGVAAGHLYQFEITNRGGDKYDPGGVPFLRIDPAARQVQSSDRRVPGFVVDPTTFTWKASFQTPSFENFIIYQAHVGSFAGRGDGLPAATDTNGSTATFADVQAKLGYIRSMNFNAVQFLPNGEYRGSEGEAYNPSNYYAPESLYGRPDDLRRLIDACHDAGLAVIFDVVYNHMDSTDNLWQFDGNTDHRPDESDASSGGGIYFSAVDTGFGRRPDHDNPQVQRFFIDNASMWFDEYHVDGLRFDSAVNFSEGGLKAIVSALITKYPDKFIYAEASDPNYIFGDIGFRACWDMDSADNFARVISGKDINGLQSLIGRFGYPTAYSAIKYLLGSHDQIYNQWEWNNDKQVWQWDKPGPPDGSLRENRYFVERIGGPITGRSNWYALAQARMGWVLNVAMPCTPMLFMGSECHHYGYWNPDNDPFSDHRLDWTIAGDATGLAMRNLVTDVNTLRWNNPALRSDLGPEFTHFDPDNRVLAFKRWNDQGNVLLIVVNLSDNQWDSTIYGVCVGAPGDRWSEIFNSQSPQYGGWNDSGNYLATLWVGPDGRINIRLPKWSVLIFQRQ